MGWPNANSIFDSVARTLIDAGVSDDIKRHVLGRLIGQLQEDDWDTADASLEHYLHDPAIIAAFADRDVHLADRRCCRVEPSSRPEAGPHEEAASHPVSRLIELYEETGTPSHLAPGYAAELIADTIRQCTFYLRDGHGMRCGVEVLNARAAEFDKRAEQLLGPRDDEEEHRYCGADLGRSTPPHTCNRRIGHDQDQPCSAETDTQPGAGVRAGLVQATEEVPS